MNEELILEEEVALRKESVDRKIPALGRVPFSTVALRKESVDRKIGGVNRTIDIIQRRSPQGERG